MMYDLIIVGGGPAGSAASVYAARKQLKTLVLTDEWGGQSAVSPDVQNWIGTPSVSGSDLATKLHEHVLAVAEPCLTVTSPARATKLEPDTDHVRVHTEDGTVHTGRAVLIAAGAKRRKLDVPGAEEFDQKGLTYCATCDGPMFSGTDVAVIGGGNAGFESAAQLLAYTKSVTLLNRSENFRADEITIEKVLAHPNMTVLKNAVPSEVVGEKFVTGLKYKDTKTNEEHELKVNGIFVEIGLIPNTDWVGDAVKLNDHKKIIVDSRTQSASHERVWAAGDCTDGLYHQNNIAAGDAVKALEDIYSFLHTK